MPVVLRTALLLAIAAASGCRVLGVSALTCDVDADCAANQGCASGVCAAEGEGEGEGSEGEGEGEGDPCASVEPGCGGPGSFVDDFSGDAFLSEQWTPHPATGVYTAVMESGGLRVTGPRAYLLTRRTVALRDGAVVQARIGEANADDGQEVRFGVHAFGSLFDPSVEVMLEKSGASIHTWTNHNGVGIDLGADVAYSSTAFALWRVTRDGDVLRLEGVSDDDEVTLVGTVEMFPELAQVHVAIEVEGSDANLFLYHVNDEGVAAEDTCAIGALRDPMCDGPPGPLFAPYFEDGYDFLVHCAIADRPDGGLALTNDGAGNTDDTECWVFSGEAWDVRDVVWSIPIDVSGAVDENSLVISGLAVSAAAIDPVTGDKFGAALRDDELWCGELSGNLDQFQSGNGSTANVVDIDSAALLEITIGTNAVECVVRDATGFILGERVAATETGLGPEPMVLQLGSYSYDDINQPATVVFGPMGP